MARKHKSVVTVSHRLRTRSPARWAKQVKGNIRSCYSGRPAKEVSAASQATAPSSTSIASSKATASKLLKRALQLKSTLAVGMETAAAMAAKVANLNPSPSPNPNPRPHQATATVVATPKQLPQQRPVTQHPNQPLALALALPPPARSAP